MNNYLSLKDNYSKFICYFFIIYFVFKIIYFALNISHKIPPDEITHFERCKIYSNSLLLPHDNEYTFKYGLLSNQPYLYYFIMGKFLKINFFSFNELKYLRIINCLIGILFIFYAYKWIQLFSDNKLSQILFIIILSNISMLSFLFSSINYDNFQNLFSVISLYYFHLFYNQKKIKDLLLTFIFLLLGNLTKTAFIPYSFILVILIFIQVSKNKNLLSIKNIKSLKEKFLFLFLIFFIILNFLLYGINLIKYKKITPSALQLIGEKNAMQNRIFARNRIVSLFRVGKLKFQEALTKTNQIKHPGDRISAISMLKKMNYYKKNKINLLNRFEYSFIWMNLMLKRIIGIAGHLVMEKKGYIFSIYKLIIIFSFICFIRFFKTTDSNYKILYLLIIFIFYSLVLMQFVNYKIYLKNYSEGAALQGRYIFPVIVPFIKIFSFYITKFSNQKINISNTIIISLFFILGDFPYFILNKTPAWLI